ncbi:MAG: fluoride efflux transporter CrcB [Planctomycetota bacterium]
MLKEWIAVVLGGVLGVSLRHLLASLFALIGSAWLPFATLAANVIGCFAIGILAQWSLQQETSKEWWVIGARVGLLGGLTTFSSFALDVAKLWNQDQRGFSVGLATGHVILGLIAVFAGLAWMRATNSQ